MEIPRRRWLRQAALLLMVPVVGCDRDRSNATPAQSAEAPKPARCDDVSGLTADEIKRRKELKYTDRASNPQQTCGGCMHLQPVPGSSSPCKRCSVLAGPVNVNGSCTAWTARIGSAG